MKSKSLFFFQKNIKYNDIEIFVFLQQSLSTRKSKPMFFSKISKDQDLNKSRFCSKITKVGELKIYEIIQ